MARWGLYCLQRLAVKPTTRVCQWRGLQLEIQMRDDDALPVQWRLVLAQLVAFRPSCAFKGILFRINCS
jgi:hypothetical protein